MGVWLSCNCNGQSLISDCHRNEMFTLVWQLLWMCYFTPIPTWLASTLKIGEVCPLHWYGVHCYSYWIRSMASSLCTLLQSAYLPWTVSKFWRVILHMQNKMFGALYSCLTDTKGSRIVQLEAQTFIFYKGFLTWCSWALSGFYTGVYLLHNAGPLHLFGPRHLFEPCFCMDKYGK